VGHLDACGLGASLLGGFWFCFVSVAVVTLGLFYLVWS